MWEGMLCAGACDNEGTRICESDETWFILNLLELYVSKMWIYYNVKIQCWNVNFSHLCHLLCLDFLIWISFLENCLTKIIDTVVFCKITHACGVNICLVSYFLIAFLYIEVWHQTSITIRPFIINFKKYINTKIILK